MGKTARKKKTPVSEIQSDRNMQEALKPANELKTKNDLPGLTPTAIFPFVLIIIGIISFAIYFNSLFNGFVFDDYYQIERNPWIKNLKYLPAIFYNSAWGFKAEPTIANYYRPLMHVIYMFSYHVFGLKPWGFHLLNILFHVGNTLLVLILASRLVGASSTNSASSSLSAKGGIDIFLSVPFITALLFAVHPIHTEAVAWVAAIPELSFTFFFLLSFYFYILPRQELKSGHLLSVVSFFLALLCKETALILWIILLAYDYAFSKKRVAFSVHFKTYIPYFAVTAVYLFLRLYALKGLAPATLFENIYSYEYIINLFPLFFQYIEKLLFPINLAALYDKYPITSIMEMKGILGIVAAVAYGLLAIIAYNKNRLVFFSLLLIAVPLLPSFYVPAFNDSPISERYLYLPSVGFVMLIAITLTSLQQKGQRYGIVVTLIILLLTGIYSIQTFGRNQVWKNDLILFTDTVKKAPESFVSHANLGNALLENGKIDEAIEQLQLVTLKLCPNEETAHFNLGRALMQKGLIKEAITEYKKTLSLDPNHPDAHHYIVIAYAKSGMIDEAIDEYQNFNKFNPNSLETYINLGIDLEKWGLVNEAIAIYKKALLIDPDNSRIHYSLENAYLKSGQVDKSIEIYKAQVRLKPNVALYHNILGAAYMQKKLYDEAIKQFNIAVEIDPSNSTYRKNLDGILEIKNSAGKNKSTP